MQKEITTQHNVFEDNGEVMCAGWAKMPVLIYNKADSKSSHHSEREAVFVSNGEAGFYLLTENLGSELMIKLVVADFKAGGIISDCITKRTLLTKYDLPFGDGSELVYEDKRIQLSVSCISGGMNVECNFLDFGGRMNLYAKLRLKKINGEGLRVIAPFERNRKFFFMKSFNPQFTASGVVKIGGKEYRFEDESTLAYTDSNRFFKPRPHNYQQLCCNTVIGGQRFALNLASRVGDNRYGNENCFFVNDRLIKLGQINVKSSGGRLSRPWFFKGGISAFDLCFTPFTIAGKPMSADMKKTTAIFGRLYGTINHTEFEKPIVVDNALAHMIFEEF